MRYCYTGRPFKYSFGRSLLRKGRSLIWVGPAKEIKYSKNLGCSSLLYAECLFLYIFYLMNVPKSSYPRIVIIGGGFAGISLAKKLSKKEVQVVLIDKHNYHTFQPLLYQVSTGGLEPDSIAYPIRKILQDFPNIIFRLANVEEIRTEDNRIRTKIGDLEYDYLVIATGSKTNYYGNAEIKSNSMSMKTIPQSLNLRSLILENFEEA